MPVTVADWSVRIIGYTTLTPADVSSRLDAHRVADVVGHPGNFVIAATRPSETYLITSAYGTTQYFYTTHAGQFFHGSTVAEILIDSRLPFRWNYQALAALFSLEHLTGTQTLHPDVHRTPPGSIVHFKDGAARVTTLSWEDLHPPEPTPSRPDAATDILVEEVARFAGPDPVLSASAGFDSRLLLAALLRAGRKPRLLVAGSPKSTDRQVTEEMARRFKLDVIPIELKPEDFPPAANIIAQATSGTKPALHWHTYLYPHLAGLFPTTPLFVGANGEFARSYYLNKGIFSRATSLLPPKPMALKFWNHKSLLSRTVRREEYVHLSADFREALGRAEVEHAERMWSLHPAPTLLDHLDQTYLYERVRNFISNGLTLYSLSATPITPFLSTRWVWAIARLPRAWKLGSAYHRRAIQYLEPALLTFYEEGTHGPMTPKPIPFYYRRNNVAPVPPFDRNAVFDHPAFAALLPAHADATADLVDPTWVSTLTRQSHLRLIGILLPLAIWRTLLSAR